MEIGIRDLRDSLSRYLREVERGEAIVVTDHGRAIARIIPVGIPPDLQTLISDGRLTWNGERFEAPTNAPRMRSGRLASDDIMEDRG